MQKLLQRRPFIKTFAFATAYSSLLGRSRTNIVAAEVQPLAVPSTGTLRVRLQDFPALLQESGSVRLGINPLRGRPPAGPTPNGQFYPVIINRGANATFFALNSRCTHQGCAVDAMDASSNLITCPCHGSIFSTEGRRISGLATAPLAKYTVSFDGRDTLQVQIPNLGYSIVSSSVQEAGSGGARFRLDFRALRNVEYEVHFRKSIDEDPTPITFATTPDAPIEQNVLTATTNTDVSLFVERSSVAGFYVVSARVSEM
ncbi:MAG: Rieske (2Fe-2S) protein [Verrucomicrobiales bacterium]|nr:Rieske (2Fe-2S) protein [Verrucomicrobiales bacterium]